jgi:peptide/nickel transport system ATP-binding protein/oligopeptide transport system ATP-binding protein
MTVGDIVGEPLLVHGIGDRKSRRRSVEQLLEVVGFNPDFVNRYPHEFSGGQRQRIGIARALALNPSLIVCDEPVSALDVSIQAQILNLLKNLQDDFGLAYLFIAHDLAVVRHVAHRVAVLYLGTVVETGPVDAVYAGPAHPYTQALMSATPVPDPRVERRRERILLPGDPPDPTDPPSGCRFRTRCPRHTTELDEAQRRRCRDETPALEERGDGHPVACHFSGPRR